MQDCIRCRTNLSRPDANYCGECGFPIFESDDEQTIREQSRTRHYRHLDSADVGTIVDCINGDQQPPRAEYHWYLEECVRLMVEHLALLQRWEWFDEGEIPGLFFSKDLLEENPSDESMRKLLVWCRLWQFLYAAHGKRVVEFAIEAAVMMEDGIDDVDDVAVSINIDAT